MIDPTAVDERILEIEATSSGDHPYNGQGSSNKYSINGEVATLMLH